MPAMSQLKIANAGDEKQSSRTGSLVSNASTIHLDPKYKDDQERHLSLAASTGTMSQPSTPKGPAMGLSPARDPYPSPGTVCLFEQFIILYIKTDPEVKDVNLKFQDTLSQASLKALPSPSHSSSSPSPLQHQQNPHHYYSSPLNNTSHLHPSQVVSMEHRKLLLGGIPPDADLAQVQHAITDPDYSGWMHIKKQGQLGWRKRFVCLKESHLFLFKSDEVFFL
jgi:hypothetical protein